MLFTFPENALNCNWFNPAIIDTLTKGMDAVDSNELPEEWQDCLPDDLPDNKRNILIQKRGLRDHLGAFWEGFRNLAEVDKETVRGAIMCQTNLPELFTNGTPCPSADDLQEDIKENAKQLARYLFDQLLKIKDGEKNLRDTHFDTIQTSGIQICPFCGLHYFRSPNILRNELDHIMAISKYPFVAADFRNLVPICKECNSVKGDTDILVDENGSRRKCSDPYSGPIFTVCLAGSEFGNGNECNGIRMPRWEINLLPKFPEATACDQQAATWDAVYKIKTRYEHFLDKNYSRWIEHFAKWFVLEVGKNKSPSEVAAELCRYVCNVVQYRFDEQSFLKVDVFKFLDRSCRDEDIGQEVKNRLWDFVKCAT